MPIAQHFHFWTKRIPKHCPIHVLKVNMEGLLNSSRFQFLPDMITFYCTGCDDPSMNINKSPLVWGESFMPLPLVTMFSRMMPILHLPPTSSQWSHFCKHNILFIYSMLTVYDTWEVTFKRLSWSVTLLIAHWGWKEERNTFCHPNTSNKLVFLVAADWHPENLFCFDIHMTNW